MHILVGWRLGFTCSLSGGGRHSSELLLVHCGERSMELELSARLMFERIICGQNWSSSLRWQ